MAINVKFLLSYLVGEGSFQQPQHKAKAAVKIVPEYNVDTTFLWLPMQWSSLLLKRGLEPPHVEILLRLEYLNHVAFYSLVCGDWKWRSSSTLEEGHERGNL